MRHKPRTLTPSQEGRLFVGLLLQPFVAGGVTFVLFRLLLLDRPGRTLAGSTPDDPGGAAFAVAISTGIVAFMATLLLALPAVVWLLLRQGTVSLRVAVLVGRRVRAHSIKPRRAGNGRPFDQLRRTVSQETAEALK